MNTLISKINVLKNTEIQNIITNKIKEFKMLYNKSNNELFKELCFCILAANYSAEKTIEIQRRIGDCFITDSEVELASKLSTIGYRFPNTRAHYITESRKYKDKLNTILQTLEGNDLREWLITNIKGLGLKESSHFLRNIGFNDYAIIDFHILNLLKKHTLINPYTSLTKRRYALIEKILKSIAEKTGLNLAELDLYLWYLETGKILK